MHSNPNIGGSIQMSGVPAQLGRSGMPFSPGSSNQNQPFSPGSNQFDSNQGNLTGNQQQMIAAAGNEGNEENKQSDQARILTDQGSQEEKEKLSELMQPPQIARGYIVEPSDRIKLENKYLKPLVCQLEHLDELKKDVLKMRNDEGEAKQLHRGKDMLRYLSMDGIYVDDPEVHQKFTDANVQKLEERLLNNKESEFFKHNGELKLDNDLLADEMTKPYDQAFGKTPAFQTKETNAILCDRIHAYKKRYYRLDIVVGKIQIFKYKDLFGDECQLAQELEEQYKEYETRVSLMMIPFLKERYDFISAELQMKSRPGSDATEDDLTFLMNSKTEVENSLEKEKKEVQTMANAMYDTWKEIIEIRKKNEFNASNVNLKIYEQKQEDNTVDYLFDINPVPLDKEFKNDGKKLPGSEKSRRRNIEDLKVQCALYLNNKRVAVTDKNKVKNWPTFHAEFNEQFQVNIFTMPSSIKLEIMINGSVVDMVNVQVPGEHVKSLTCASGLVQRLNFSEYEYKKGMIAPVHEPFQDRDKMTEAAKKTYDAKLKQKDQKEKEKREKDINGELYVKTIWHGNGPKMPPIKSENLFKKPKVHKNRKEYSLEDEQNIQFKQLYIDVNDPRNEKIIKLLRETRNEFLVKLLSDDAKNLLASQESFRHKLIEARYKDPTFEKMFVPMLENELIDSSLSSFFLQKLEEIFKKEAYLKHQELRVKLQKDQREAGVPTEQLFDSADLGSIQRRTVIYDMIKERQIEQTVEGKGSSANYKNVIKEEELFDYDDNALFAVFNKLFQTGRKLKPIVRQTSAVPYETQKECKIMIHLIKGENIPIRNEVFEAFERFQGGHKDKFGDKSLQNHRPTAHRPMSSGMQNYDQEQERIEDQTAGMAGNAMSEDQLHRQPQVQTYVEVKIQYHEKYAVVKRTKTDEGRMPRWNEILDFALVADNKNFTLEELSSSSTMIIVSLFDQQDYQTHKEGKIITRSEHRFLGAVHIPLQSILSNPGKCDFNFRLHRPLLLPTYKVTDNEIYFMGQDDLDKQRALDNEHIASYLNLSVSLDPPIELPTENSEAYYPGAENPELLVEGSKWVKAMHAKCKKFKHPNIQIFGVNVRGASVFIPRFLHPLKPPTDIVPDITSDYAIEQVARFVSMCPFIEDLRMFKDLPDLFCTCQQFFDLGGGDYEEHAILLANYFNYIDDAKQAGYKSYIVLGEAMPEGATVYVLRKINNKAKVPNPNNSIEIWAPLTGECYWFKETSYETGMCGGKTKGFDIILKDPICPMKNVHTIISDDNVYVNIQKSDYPVLMSFDLSNTKKWSPFFDKSSRTIEKFFPEGIETCQTVDIEYAPVRNDTAILENRIQKYLVDMFQDKRVAETGKPTTWAINHNDQLYLILADCEEHCMKARKGTTTSTFINRGGKNENMLINEIIENFKEKISEKGSLTQNKRAWGFPLNTTFVSLDECWRLVQNTKIYAVNRRDVDFALSVKIISYPCNILSVWIYVAAFVDNFVDY